MLDMSDPSACWVWPGPRFQDGYSQVANNSAHRWIWERFIGPIPAGMEIDHTCHSSDPECVSSPACPHRPCVNYVHHLELVTPLQNQKRKWERIYAQRAI
jgi:hypothetical protein